MKSISTFITLVLALTLSNAADPFHVYVPSRDTGELLIIEGIPTEDDGLTLALVDEINLGFPATTIVAHPEKPLLYISTNNSESDPAPGALVTLDPAGDYHSDDPLELKHGYAYLSLDRANRFLLGANYRGGQIDVYSLKENGALGPRVAALDEGRPTAHCVLPSPDNSFVYIPYVKDQNALYQYQFDPASGNLTALDPLNADPPEGTGPRHMAYHPTLPFVYFSNEQGIGVSVYEKLESGQLKFKQNVEVIPASERPEKGASASDITITPDARFLFTGQRSGDETALPNAINRYRINDDGQVEHLGATPADAIPWGLALSPDGHFLLVTAFKGGTLTAYEITEDGDLIKAASLPIPEKISDLVTR
ncbi:MAG: beta-propeller fold lactonase family protein [Verrucomicrobiota bacterium]